MLTIRKEQVQAFAEALFESWMLRHLEEFFPQLVLLLDPTEIRKRIGMAVEQAHNYGFFEDSQVCRYVDLTFLLGSAFAEDPNLPWASEILGDDRVQDPAMRIDLLWEAAEDHIDCAEQKNSSANNTSQEVSLERRQ